MSAPRYDIVGCGAVVQQYHLPVLKLLQQDLEMSVAGCYDNDVALAQRVAELLGADEHGAAAAPREGDGVDAAIVATPPPSHAEIAGAYLRAGKSAFVEKPLTTRASEAAELVSQSRQAGSEGRGGPLLALLPERQRGAPMAARPARPGRPRRGVGGVSVGLGDGVELRGRGSLRRRDPRHGRASRRHDSLPARLGRGRRDCLGRDRPGRQARRHESRATSAPRSSC